MVSLGDRKLGFGHPVFVIAEAGVNHNGDLKLAKRLVEVAKASGADAVKFQTFKAEGVASRSALIAKYQQRGLPKEPNQVQLLRGLELSYNDFLELKRFCDKVGIMFLSTPHSDDAIDFLERLVPAYKIGSGDLTNIPLLKKVASKGKPVILSTGMGAIAEISEAVRSIRANGNDNIILLQATTAYPCPPEAVNLRAMVTLREEFGCLVGFSDHTTSTLTPAIAVALGACVIEKHFTLDKGMPGPDHRASLEPSELKAMVANVRYAERVLGSYEKSPTEPELDALRVTRKSIVARTNIKKGNVITIGMLCIKRPGTGIPPNKLQSVVGRVAKKGIKADQLITWDMLGEP